MNWSKVSLILHVRYNLVIMDFCHLYQKLQNIQFSFFRMVPIDIAFVIQFHKKNLYIAL